MMTTDTLVLEKRVRELEEQTHHLQLALDALIDTLVARDRDRFVSLDELRTTIKQYRLGKNR